MKALFSRAFIMTGGMAVNRTTSQVGVSASIAKQETVSKAQNVWGEDTFFNIFLVSDDHNVFLNISGETKSTYILLTLCLLSSGSWDKYLGHRLLNNEHYTEQAEKRGT